MRSDYEPIIVNTPKDFEQITLYFLHDIHKGSAQHDDKKFDAVMAMILDDPSAYCCIVGDAIENAIPGGKSDVFYQTIPPHEQKEWVAAQLERLGDKVLAVVDGNHERNRSTKTAGLFPLYDACARVRMEDRYRPHFAALDIGVGLNAKQGGGKQTRYFGYLVHQAKNQVRFGAPDMLEGFDFLVSGHDHQPHDRPRGKIVYDPYSKAVRHRDVEHINCGAFMTYGDYASDAGRRPAAQKMYKLVLAGKSKKCGMRTIGFYVETTR